MLAGLAFAGQEAITPKTSKKQEPDDAAKDTDPPPPFVAGSRNGGASNPCPAPYRARRPGAGGERHRDQDRQHQRLFRPGFRLRHHLQGRGRLFQDDQRRRRGEWPQDHLHLLRRRLQPAEDRGDGAPAGGARRSGADVQSAGHGDEHGHLQIPEPEGRAASVRVHRGGQMGRLQGTSVDDDVVAELPGGGAGLCQIHQPDEAGRQDRAAVSERRFRQGLRQRLQGRSGRQIREHRQDRFL